MNTAALMCNAMCALRSEEEKICEIDDIRPANFNHKTYSQFNAHWTEWSVFDFPLASMFFEWLLSPVTTIFMVQLRIKYFQNFINLKFEREHKIFQCERKRLITFGGEIYDPSFRQNFLKCHFHQLFFRRRDFT